MNDSKRYYWIKLKTDFFTQGEIDFLLSQKNGCQYVVLYQMLCVQTANQNGRLGTQLGECFIPYDIQKIVRDTKYFDVDTVRVALELYKKLNLICVEEGCMQMTGFENIVGSETYGAKRKREQRKEIGSGTDNETSDGTILGTKSLDVPTELVTKQRTISETFSGTDGRTILGQCPIEKDIDIDSDVDLDIKKEKEKEEEEEDEEEDDDDDDEKAKIENFENKSDESETIKDKIKKVFGFSHENIVSECLSYQKYLSSDVIIYALSVTAGAKNPCWNYAKKVLETYKLKKLSTLELLLEYENGKQEKVAKLPKNVPKQKFAFMEDYHTPEEWEALYDN